MNSKSALPLRDITEAYRDEYYNRASAMQTGWLGKLNRLLNKLPGHDKAESRFFVTALAVGAPLAFVSMLVPAFSMIAVAVLTGAAIATSLAAHGVACKASARMLTADIANGLLGKRYAEEILKPRNDVSLHPVIERLSSPLTQNDKTAVSAFSACAADASESKSLDEKRAAGPTLKR